MNFYFDIETIQTQRQDFIDDLTADIKPPANYKSAEAIGKWEKEKKPGLMKKAVEQSVFDGGMGEIIAFSCAVDDGEIISVYREGDQTHESGLLGQINEIFDDLLVGHRQHHVTELAPIWIGHYITGYDLRFLWKRFVINRIKPAVKIPYDAKPWDKQVFDTCTEWKGASDKGSMDFVCKALGLEGKTGMDGSMVYQAWLDGKYKEISDYCAHDVEMTREIHKALTFK